MNECDVNESRFERWNMRKYNWGDYRGSIMSSAEEYGSEELRALGAEDMVDLLYDWIRKANMKCMKRMKMSNRHELVWWNEDLKKKKSDVKRKRKKYQQEKRREGERVNKRWNEYKKCVKEYKEMMRKAKEQNWQEFVSKKGADDVWKVIRICMGKNGNNGLSSLKVGNEWTKDWTGSANVLVNEFFPPDDGIPILEEELHGNADGHIIDQQEISINELKCAVKLMSMGKSPGIDGVANEMIRLSVV